MISIDIKGNIYRWTKEHGSRQINIGEVTERELLLFIAVKLYSIRGMILFFTSLTAISLVVGIILIMIATSGR